MRIATWNVESLRRLSPGREAAFQLAMAGIDADVWVLTETWTTFSPGPGYRLVARSGDAVDLKAWPDRCWVSIWAKPLLVVMPLGVRAHRDRLAVVRIATPDRPDLVVVGTVLPWKGDKLWPGATDFCAAVASQAEEWRALRGGPDGGTLVVAGDFNQSVPYAQ
jgi:exonuclease III